KPILESSINKYGLRPPPPSGVLAWTVATEKSNNDDGETVLFLVSPAEVLIVYFGKSISPTLHVARSKPKGALFRKWNIRVFPIHVRSGGKKHSLATF